MAYPRRYPSTICIYENCDEPTQPGTEINVTPDNDAPIIPKATIYQGDLLLPRKKDSLFAFFPVMWEIHIRIPKYIIITSITAKGDIFKILLKIGIYFYELGIGN